MLKVWGVGVGENAWGILGRGNHGVDKSLIPLGNRKKEAWLEGSK